MIGLQKDTLEFSHPAFHKKEVTLMSSRNATREDFAYVIQNMVNRKVNPRAFITTRVKFEKVADGFPEWLAQSGHVIKVIVEKE